MIIRVFRAQIHKGKEKQFEDFFFNTALPRMKKRPGCVSAMVGKPLDSSSNEYLMVMVWENVEAIKNFAGENWREARIDPAEVDLLKSTLVYHYEKV